MLAMGLVIACEVVVSTTGFVMFCLVYLRVTVCCFVSVPAKFLGLGFELVVCCLHAFVCLRLVCLPELGCWSVLRWPFLLVWEFMRLLF